MKSEDLIKVWNAPDNSKLTPKQMSIRLPIHVAASISALAEMYPRKTKTEIIGDLLATAIDQLTGALSTERDVFYDENDPDSAPFESPSDSEKFKDLKEKYIQELEKEIEESKAK